jgi:hypothetical protein
MPSCTWAAWTAHVDRVAARAAAEMGYDDVAAYCARGFDEGGLLWAAAAITDLLADHKRHPWREVRESVCTALVARGVAEDRDAAQRLLSAAMTRYLGELWFEGSKADARVAWPRDVTPAYAPV